MLSSSQCWCSGYCWHLELNYNYNKKLFDFCLFTSAIFIWKWFAYMYCFHLRLTIISISKLFSICLILFPFALFWVSLGAIFLSLIYRLASSLREYRMSWRISLMKKSIFFSLSLTPVESIVTVNIVGYILAHIGEQYL